MPSKKECILYTHMVIISTKIGKRKEKKKRKKKERLLDKTTTLRTKLSTIKVN